jgi:type IV pilus assembly protein PilX
MGIFMRSQPCFTSCRLQQTGAVLFVSLVLLIILTLLAVSAARMQTVEERMARNENNRQIGLEAAEAALRSVEAGLQSGIYQNFGTSPGLYVLNSELQTYNGSVVPTLDWTNASQVQTYSGPTLSAVPTVPAPKYIIERLPPVVVVVKGRQLNGGNPVPVYRVTVQAFGADRTSTTTLQSIEYQAHGPSISRQGWWEIRH